MEIGSMGGDDDVQKGRAELSRPPSLRPGRIGHSNCARLIPTYERPGCPIKLVTELPCPS